MASENTVTTTIRVSFGSGQGGAANIQVEVDDRPDGFNSGKTSFNPGDTAWFLVYLPPGYALSGDPALTGGNLDTSRAGTVITLEKEVDVVFENTDEATLPYPAQSIISAVWMGNSLGSLTILNDATTLKATTKGFAVARIKYRTQARAYGVISPTNMAGLADFTIAAYLVAEK